MSDFVVGLTGGIGSGKSTVGDLLVAAGAALVDTDAIAHELTAPGGAALPELVAAFGPQIADERGALDRAAMRRLAFADPVAKAKLEGILHPLIRQLAAERCRLASTPYVVLAVPLLVESGNYRQRCDRVLAVDCPESRQIERVMARNGMAENEVKAIMAAQATRQQRLAAADDVVFNDGGLAALSPQVAELHQKYLRLSAEKAKANC
ncbi:dephospho-CoA kinase [Dechloromonas denitrificans]|uniref:Dephospho-CoA kinase n=1 Tax=Dechloromonas denitrificans TaxID=281362 RepID=A0A133XDW5_9RHOO|nr:dephospho-CoA kinase [Dechloromonas denitrificans]KXB29121.1 dephospho-CoA kinase [Dechloromonas denitrificans]